MPVRNRSEVQLRLAAKLGISVEDDSYLIAAAKLLDAVAPAVGHDPTVPSTERQREFASSLRVDVAGDSKRVASAKISEALEIRNQEAVIRLDLNPGDRVLHVTHIDQGERRHTLKREFVVSSVGKNGRVYFKGGGGRSAWATELEKARSG